jgi:gliding motility associated protien GldN
MSIGLSISAQVLDPGTESPLDGVYSKSVDTPHKRPVPYVQLREADIMWLTRIWRVVDMREKVNQAFYFPLKPTQGRKNFMTVIMEGIEQERITAYSPYDSSTAQFDDGFKISLTSIEAKRTLSYTTQITVYNEYDEEEYKDTLNEIGLDEITRFKIKEEIFFDKQRSLMETRILGIAPMIPDKIADDGSVREAFWIYFPEARFVFAEAEIYNVHNDADRMTYEELFWKRKFSSRVVKESNVYDRSISDYKGPLDALLEAEKMEEEIFNREHDLWSF